VRVEIAALLLVDGVIGRIEDAATEFVQEHLAKFAAEIANTTGDVRDRYRKVQEQTSAPEALTIELRHNEKAATKNADGTDLPRYPGHLFSDPSGMFPAKLDEWEKEVVAIESERSSFVAWYRNPSRPTPNSLRIAYQNDAGAWASLQVDFVIVSRRDDGSLGASIIDPHGDFLADARAKLLALADFAEEYGDRFVRIWSISAGGDGSLHYLDLQEPTVRATVRAFDGAKITALYDAPFSIPYQ
jgi:type III restriction enzyme